VTSGVTGREPLEKRVVASLANPCRVPERKRPEP